MARRNRRGTKIKAQPGRIVTYLRRAGTRRGFLGGSRAWMAVGVTTWGYTKLKQMAERKAEVVFSEELKPGQRIIISNNRPTVDRRV